MIRKIIRHSAARRDILDEAYYIAEDDLDASDLFLQATEAAFSRLVEMPGLGVSRDFSRPELQGMRMWPVPGFRSLFIFYRADDEALEILRVLHSARDIAGLFNPTDKN